MRIDGFRFFFYANEHLPRHVHVKKGDGFAKIDLESMRVMVNTFNPSELRNALEITRQHRDEFVEAWNGFFA